MKLLFTVLALFIFNQAKAHSEMSDSFLQMPVGTYLIAKKNINVKPKTSSLFLVNGKLYSENEILINNVELPSPAVKCEIRFESSAYDREITAEQSFFKTIAEPYQFNPRVDMLDSREPFIMVSLDRPESEFRRYLTCQKSTQKNEFKSVSVSLSIQDVKNALGGYFEIRFPSPVDFM